MPDEKKLHDSESNGIDLQKILERGEKGKTYTVEEIKELMDAYIKGAEQEAVAARPSERVVLTFYIRTVIISERNKIRRF